MSVKTVKIFLASSSELQEERREFEIAMQRKNDELIHNGIYLDVVVWEDYLDQISKTRLQDEYNKVILECDIFIMLFFTKVGKFTYEEFEIAHKSFLKTGKPKVFTYFKNAPIDTGALNEYDTTSLFQFKNKLKEIGHYVTHFKSMGDLKYHFSEQLSKLEILKSDIKIVSQATPSQTQYISDNLESINSTKNSKKNKTLLFGGVGLLSIAVITFLIILKPWSNSNLKNTADHNTMQIAEASKDSVILQFNFKDSQPFPIHFSTSRTLGDLKNHILDLYDDYKAKGFITEELGYERYELELILNNEGNLNNSLTLEAKGVDNNATITIAPRKKTKVVVETDEVQKGEIIPVVENKNTLKETPITAIGPPEYCRIDNTGGHNNRGYFLNAIGNGIIGMGKETTSSGTKWHLIKITELEGEFYRLENRGGSNDRLKLLNAIGNGQLSMTNDLSASGTTWELIKVTQWDGHFYQFRNRGGSNDRLKYLNAVGDGKVNMTDDTRASGITWLLHQYE